jgi:hypothetical protein
MRANEVIETYINDTVRLLPRRMRNDVAIELGSLLNEELHAKAEESGRAPDESLALSLVRGFGSPNEAAARYQPPWAIIEPADSTNFMRAAFIGALALLVLSVLNRRKPSLAGTGANVDVTAILAWLGFLVVVFGIRNWIRRRSPKRALWEPRDRDRVYRLGTALMVPIATFFVVLYAAPAWMLDHLSGGRFDTSWATYTEEFQHFGLPGLVGLWAGLLALLSFAALRGSWSWFTRRIDLGLNLAMAGLILFLAVNGNIFRSSVVNDIAREVLALVAAIYIPSLGVRIYGEIGRLDRAAATTEAQENRPPAIAPGR